MIITRIEEQKKNKKRCNIYIDGEYYCSIDKDVQEELHFHEGMELNEIEFNQTVEIIEYKSALRAALYILTRASKTERELEKKLKDKQHSEKAIVKVLKYLKEIGYINDESYTEFFIKSMRDVSGTSKRSLYYKLTSKGIDKAIIEQKLDEAEIDDFTSALNAAQKKLRSLKGDKKENTVKLLSFLYRKGFGFELCRKIMEELDLEED
jgi:regulatory protein